MHLMYQIELVSLLGCSGADGQWSQGANDNHDDEEEVGVSEFSEKFSGKIPLYPDFFIPSTYLAPEQRCT